MNTRKAESLFVLVAAGLLIWGSLRAATRGDVVVLAWTTYAMLGLVLLAGSNIFIRSKKIAVSVMVACDLFILLALVAFFLGSVDGEPQPIPAVIRALAFFVLLGIASLTQMQFHKKVE